MNADLPPTPQSPTLIFNWQDWLPYFEDDRLTDDQKRELIETLWLLTLTFVDAGFTVCQDRKSCGQTIDLKAVLEEAVLHSDLTQDQEDAA